MAQDLDFIIGDNAKQQLIALVERVERLEEEKAGITEDVKEVYAEAKSSGFDPTIMRRAIRIRAMDPAQRKTAQDLLDTYLAAMGVE
jgi:uncharacterized protein (UPF0335 family)